MLRKSSATLPMPELPVIPRQHLDALNAARAVLEGLLADRAKLLEAASQVEAVLSAARLERQEAARHLARVQAEAAAGIASKGGDRTKAAQERLQRAEAALLAAQERPSGFRDALAALAERIHEANGELGAVYREAAQPLARFAEEQQRALAPILRGLADVAAAAADPGWDTAFSHRPQIFDAQGHDLARDAEPPAEMARLVIALRGHAAVLREGMRATVEGA